MVPAAIAIGCSAGHEAIDEGERELDPDFTSSIESEVGTCPPDKTTAARRQRTAEGLYHYIVGDNSKTPTDAVLKSAADQIRANLAVWTTTGIDGVVGVLPTHASDKIICNIKATVYRINCVNKSTGQPARCPATALNLFNSLANRAEALFPGVRPFLHVAGDTWIEFDPATARTTSTLSGANGASASAVFVNDGVATTVRKWPGSLTFCSLGSNCPRPGQPCSTGDMAAGWETNRQIAPHPSNMSFLKCW
jgi:hypothetical protein